MTEPLPDLTPLTLGVEVPGNPAPLPLGPGGPGCCPGSQTPPPVPAEGPVPGSGLVPGSGSGGFPELSDLSLGTRELTWIEWVIQVLGHWTGLYAAAVKRHRRKNPPPPESLREHVRWVKEARWNAWLPESCVRLRAVLGWIECPFQVLIAIPADFIGTKLIRGIFRQSITGLPALALIIYFLIRVL
jgi:hypothetical protein